MKRGDMPAQAINWDVSFAVAGFNIFDCMGLTIREELAARMAAGLLASASDNNGQWTHDGPKNVAREAVEMTDALLAELAKGGEQ